MLFLTREGKMSLIRAVVSVASIFLGLSAAVAQQLGTATNKAAASASSALTNPPVFQGLMVDAKGKTVGRFFPNFSGPPFGGLMHVLRSNSCILFHILQ
jgi:hypothetical protein